MQTHAVHMLRALVLVLHVELLLSNVVDFGGDALDLVKLIETKPRKIRFHEPLTSLSAPWQFHGDVSCEGAKSQQLRGETRCHGAAGPSGATSAAGSFETENVVCQMHGRPQARTCCFGGSLIERRVCCSCRLARERQLPCLNISGELLCFPYPVSLAYDDQAAAGGVAIHCMCQSEVEALCMELSLDDLSDSLHRHQANFSACKIEGHGLGPKRCSRGGSGSGKQNSQFVVCDLGDRIHNVSYAFGTDQVGTEINLVLWSHDEPCFQNTSVFVDNSVVSEVKLGVCISADVLQFSTLRSDPSDHFEYSAGPVVVWRRTPPASRPEHEQFHPPPPFPRVELAKLQEQEGAQRVSDASDLGRRTAGGGPGLCTGSSAEAE
eukprot:757342-Hanusia_phi.AAC.1